MKKSKDCKDHLGNIYSSKTDMCRFYKISVQVYDNRIAKGFSVEDALTKPVIRKIVKCEDHLGNTYNKLSDMLQRYNISISQYYNRLKLGWDIEKILTTQENAVYKPIVDHTGQSFNSIKEMLDYWNISSSLYNTRKKRGWNLEKTLTTPLLRNHREINIDDIVFDNLKSFIETLNISKSSYQLYKRRGLSDKEIYDLCVNVDKGNRGRKILCVIDGVPFYNIRKIPRPVNVNVNELKEIIIKKGYISQEDIESLCYKNSFLDHKGTPFVTQKECAEHYGITASALAARLKAGWSLEDALTHPKQDHKSITIDHIGNKFDSFNQMCHFYNINPTTVNSRIKDSGFTLEEALTLPLKMYIGEYRVAECLKRLNVRFYHDCTIKTIFNDFNLQISWSDFLKMLQHKLSIAGVNWSKSKIERLRPDFILYTDENNQIRGVIEFDGKQHQNFMEYFCKTIEEFYRRSDADLVKQSLWEYLNIPMLRIRYDQVDMIDDMVKDFIDNPQNYIHNHNTYLSEDEYWSILSEEKAKLELAFAS